MTDDPAMPRPPRAGRDVLLAVIVGLAAANFLALAPFLVYHDLNLEYPFMMGDSWDWISNGLSVAGHDVRASVRAPFLPLLIAALDRAGALAWLPVVIQAVVMATTVALFVSVRRESGARTAFAAALVVIAIESWRRQSLDVAADVLAGCLVYLALAAMQRARSSPRWYLAAGAAAGLGAVTQQVALAVVAAAAAAVLPFRREQLRTPWPWLGGLLFALPYAGWTAWKWVVFGTPGDAGVKQWALVRLHADGLFHYAWALAAYLGIPGLALAAAGVVKAFRRGRSGELAVASGAASAAAVAFFALLYVYRDSRFLAVAFLPLVVLVAGAIGRVQRPVLRRGALAAVCVWGALPVPGGAAGAAWLPLWPCPAAAVRAKSSVGRAGDVRLEPGRPDWVVASCEESLSRLSWVRVARERRVRGDALPPARIDVAGHGSAVYLEGGPTEGERYRIVTQLGNALHRRVKVVPAWWWLAFRGSMALEKLGGGGGWTVASVRLPGEPQPYLLAADVRAAGSLAAMSAPAGPTQAFHEDLPGALSRARALADCLGRRDRIVAVLEPSPGSPDPLLLYLPFFAASTELRLIGSDDAGRALREAPPTGEPPCSVEGAVASRATALGMPVTVIRLAR